jgi:mRNA-degrading endonuclease RelE of RelBE toxin-antitoxin system
MTTKFVIDQVLIFLSSSSLLFISRDKACLVSTNAPSSRLDLNKNLLRLFHTYLEVMTLDGLYSRRINRKHRLVYAIKDEIVTVLILNAYAHYGDK